MFGGLFSVRAGWPCGNCVLTWGSGGAWGAERVCSSGMLSWLLPFKRHGPSYRIHSLISSRASDALLKPKEPSASLMPPPTGGGGPLIAHWSMHTHTQYRFPHLVFAVLARGTFCVKRLVPPRSSSPVSPGIWAI